MLHECWCNSIGFTSTCLSTMYLLDFASAIMVNCGPLRSHEEKSCCPHGALDPDSWVQRWVSRLTRSIHQATYCMVTMVQSPKFSHLFPPSDFDWKHGHAASSCTTQTRHAAWTTMDRFDALGPVHHSFHRSFLNSGDPKTLVAATTVTMFHGRVRKGRCSTDMLWPQSARPASSAGQSSYARHQGLTRHQNCLLSAFPRQQNAIGPARQGMMKSVGSSWRFHCIFRFAGNKVLSALVLSFFRSLQPLPLGRGTCITCVCFSSVWLH